MIFGSIVGQDELFLFYFQSNRSKVLLYMKKVAFSDDLFTLAERVRFELTVPCGTTVFKTVAIDHSATFPFYPEFSKSMASFENRLRY